MIRLLLELLVVLVVLGLPAAAIWGVITRVQQPRPLAGRDRQLALERSSWQAFTDVRNEGTVVGIRKVIAGRSTQETVGEMTLAQIASDDPDWEVAVSQALLAARVRADVLNAEERRSLGDG